MRNDIRRKYYLILLLIASGQITAIPTQAQDSESNVQVQQFTNPSNTIVTNKNEEIHGSPFYNEDWDKGYVLYNSGERTEKMDLKYKIYTNELLFKRNSTLLAVTPGTIKGFVLIHDGQNVLFMNGFNAPKYDISPKQFMEVIYNGNVKLLDKHMSRFMRGQRPDPMSGIITSNFINKEDYFLVDSNGNFHDIKLKDKDILRALNAHQKELKKYAHTNNLSFKHRNDLKKILVHYDKINLK